MDVTSAFRPKNPLTQSARAKNQAEDQSNDTKGTPKVTQQQQASQTSPPQRSTAQPANPPLRNTPLAAAPDLAASTNQALSDEELAQLYDQEVANSPQPLYGPVQEELYFEWSAESRPFKPQSRQFYTTAITIALLISLILFFSGQILPIAVVIALFFVFYVLNSIPPQTVTHQMTSFGMRCAGTLYAWEELGRFWFTRKHNKDILNIEVARFPGRVMFLLGEISVEDMREIMAPLLPEQEPAHTTFEKMGAWLQETFPIDVESPKG